MASVLSGSYWTNLGATLIATVRSFPRESVISIAMSASFCVAVAEPTDDLQHMAIRTGMGLMVALAASLAVTILRRAEKINTITDWLIAAAATGLSVWHAQSLNFDNADGIVEFSYLFTAVHLCVACAWAAYGSASSFWNGTTTLFYRAIYAGVFTSILTSGLTLAIAAVRVLFGLFEFNELEEYVAATGYGTFMTLFFLSDVPTRDSVAREPIVPKLTITFVQYVLVPLVGIFTVILYAYAVKLLTTSVSTDMVHYAVWLSGVSVLASLLTWPLRNEPGPLLRILHTWLYPILLPLLMIGAWSLSVRFATEGIDHVGYTLGVFESIALLTVIISMALRRSDPRIPAFVALVVFAITSVGPLGVNAVVHRSQGDHAKVVSAGSSASNTTGLPEALDEQPNIASSTTDDHWFVSFSVDAGDTLSTSDASVTCTEQGMVKVYHRGTKDTVQFKISDVLKSTSKTDTLYKPLTITLPNNRRATLLCSSITTWREPPGDTTSKRTLSQVRGAVICEGKKD